MQKCVSVHNSAERLVSDVIKPGLCSGCGACIGYCPYIKSFGERVGVVHDCKKSEGTCYRVCPRAATSFTNLRKIPFGDVETDPVFGSFKEINYARACDEDIRSRGQYGGVVTALSIYALQTGVIDSALMTGGSFTGARPFIASSAGEILACTGSKYTAAPNLSVFQDAVKEGFNNIGVVGRPCQCTAARKMQQVAEIKGERISLIIGLFCMGSFSPEFYKFIKEKGLDEYEKMDIPGDVNFKKDNKETSLPYDEVREYIRNSCSICFDPLSELADLSVGSTEYDYGWNTLIIRSEKGSNLAKEAAANGIIEIKEYPAPRLPLLRKAVFNKKKRVLERPDATYLEISGQEREYFLANGGGA
ncbi:Coenzyme F420 hydrogenase/dehydrogenase, beta subunit C-terminal domain [Pelotomaculum propionicicum]|uniref:Coenzyme F420 hydrogenase/dehydrogenase, beta subunit C-terminal domain n=1 Tax=Pelotomaculum propionicicum TaxID=258475 RepID=UPI003B77D903